MKENEKYVTTKLFLEKNQQIQDQFKQIDQRFEQVDQRFDQMDGRLDRMDQRFDKMDQRFEGLDQKFEGLDQKVNRIAFALVKTQEDVKEIRETMATKNDIQKILDQVDAFAAGTASLDRNAIIHEYRLSVLEKHCGVKG
ncbi:MAG: hypothetical protein ACKVQC_05225 [Elusimicrobiota bacterium]